METFCARSGVKLFKITFQLHVKAVRFMHEGERLKETDTPESVKFVFKIQLELEDGDEIDAMVEQHGGNSGQINYLLLNNKI